MNSGAVFLFTYGTLMNRFDNPFATRLRSASVYRGEGSIPGSLYRISWYPGALYQDGVDQRVYGEIYELIAPAELLSELDEYEDVMEDESNSLYLRKIVPVVLPDQTILPCWAYLYNQPVDGLEQINTGRFE
jgi:gamma-glutamylcyclotransferase (GGCT)/AIG2-like uncharacterized protein YtfP